MDKEIIKEMIRVAPTLLLYATILIVFLRYRKSFVEGILPKISGFKAFGIEASFVRDSIEGAARTANKADVQVSPSLMRRLAHYPRRPLRILWVDDNPDTVLFESGILQNLGIMVEFAKNSANALEKLAQNPYQLLISDIRRGQKAAEGLDFLAEIRRLNRPQPLIFYVSELDKNKGIPTGAFGITDDPNELIHLVLDTIERMDF